MRTNIIFITFHAMKISHFTSVLYSLEVQAKKGRKELQIHGWLANLESYATCAWILHKILEFMKYLKEIVWWYFVMTSGVHIYGLRHTCCVSSELLYTPYKCKPCKSMKRIEKKWRFALSRFRAIDWPLLGWIKIHQCA
jgi:hypothetical protein